MSRWLGVARGLFVLAAGSLALFSGCDREPGFECGRVAPGSSTIRTCDRALEVCVCSTNSCAKKVGIPPAERGGFAGANGAADPTETAGAAAVLDEWGDCSGPGMSGYKYAEAPFARDDRAGKCVPLSDLRLGPIVPNDTDPGPGCPGQVHLPDASTGGTSGGGGSAGSAGMNSAGSAGTSGDAGSAGSSGNSGSGGSAGSTGGMSGSAGDGGAMMSAVGGA